MSLQEIYLTLKPVALPKEIGALIEEATRRTDVFYAEGLGLRYPKYVPSDPKKVYAAIAHLKEDGYLQGNVFCEWGCGFAIASSIAALLGMEAYGLEIEEEIADRAAGLVKELGIPVKILRESYLPEGFEDCEGMGGKDLITPESITTSGGVVAPPQYEGLDPADVDLFFVYPWPGEEELMEELFAAVASPGAVLLMSRDDGEFVAYC